MCELKFNYFIFSESVVNRRRTGVSATITRPSTMDTSPPTDGSPGSVFSQPNFVYPGKQFCIIG